MRVECRPSGGKVHGGFSTRRVSQRPIAPCLHIKGMITIAWAEPHRQAVVKEVSLFESL